MLQFAFTITGLDHRDLDSIDFRVKVNGDVQVVNLLPLRHEMNQPETLANAGQSVSIEVDPTVVAYGLQQKDFYWEMTGKALSNGAHQFIALIEIPSGSQRVPVTLGVACRMKQSFLSQGGILHRETSYEIPVQ